MNAVSSGADQCVEALQPADALRDWDADLVFAAQLPHFYDQVAIYYFEAGPDLGNSHDLFASSAHLLADFEAGGGDGGVPTFPAGEKAFPEDRPFNMAVVGLGKIGDVADGG
jgi:hypothetical protein